MPIYPYDNVTPQIGEGVYIAPSADIIGKVAIGDNASVWFQCILRGDMCTITIGEDTNVQDLTMIHVNDKDPVVIGKGVTIGHQCNIHSCKIGDNCLIGIGSTILDGAEIGENSLVAAGSLVPPGKKFPPGAFLMGTPAKVVRDLTPEEAKGYGAFYHHYTSLKEEYLAGKIGDPLPTT